MERTNQHKKSGGSGVTEESSLISDRNNYNYIAASRVDFDGLNPNRTPESWTLRSQFELANDRMNLNKIAQSTEQLREQLARSPYSTNHTIGIGDTKRQIRTSSGIHEMGLAYPYNSTLQTINAYEDNSAIICNQLLAEQNIEYHASKNFRDLPQNYRGYQQSQLQPIKQSTSSAAAAGFIKGQMLKQRDEAPLITPGYFFESPSKYISLKESKEQCISTPSSAQPPQNTQTPVFDYQPINPQEQPRYTQKLKNAKEWFDRLCLQDKSIVLTIVDKQLVNLIYQMYRVYQQEGNVKFQNNQYSPQEAHHFERVKHYNLLYKKHIQVKDMHSTYSKNIQEGENALITNVRLLNVLTHNQATNNKNQIGQASLEQSKKKGSRHKGANNKQEGVALAQVADEQIGGQNYINQFDAITLDLSLYTNNAYLSEIMRYSNGYNHFLGLDMQLQRDKDAVKWLEQSVFYENRSCNDDPTSRFQYSIKTRSPYVNAELPQKYMTFVHEPAKSNNQDSLIQGMTLGKCLVVLFERAINIQYQDFLNKLDKQAQQFFFLQDPSLYTNIFVQDQRLTHYLASKVHQNPPVRDQILKYLDTIEQNLISEDHLNNNNQRTVQSQNKPSVIKEDFFEDESDSSKKPKKDRGASYLEYMVRKEEQEIDSIQGCGTDEEDRAMNSRYERTRGVASSQLHMVKDRDDGEEDEEDEDPEAYKYPNINKGSTATEIFDSEEEDEHNSFDLESQHNQAKRKPQEIYYAGTGPVGKLKALRSSRGNALPFKNDRVVHHKIAHPTFLTGDTNLRAAMNDDGDDEEQYGDDFEEESNKQDEEDEQSGSTPYFFDHESKYNRSQSNQKSKQTKQAAKVGEVFKVTNDNPLMTNNKYFIIKQELQKDILRISTEDSSKDKIELLAFKFIKKLSSFIDFEIIDSGAQSGSTNFKQLPTYFSRENSITGMSMTVRLPGLNSIALIPFKQRLYQYLLKLYDDSNWDDILESSTPSTQLSKAQSSGGNNTSSSTKKQSIEDSKDESNPAANACASSKAKNKKRKQKEKRQKQKEEQANQMAKLDKQIIEIEMEDLSKNKKKETSANKAQQSSDEEGTNQVSKKVDPKVVQEIKQEKFNIEKVKEQLMKEQDWRQQSTIYDSITGNFRGDLPPASIISRGLRMSFPLEDEAEIRARNQKRHIEERTSLLTGMYQKDKYSEDFYSNVEESLVEKFDSTTVLNDPSKKFTHLINEDVEMKDESKVEAPEGQKKKKNRKNKNKKKKKGATAGTIQEDAKAEDDIDAVIELDDIQIGIDTTINGRSNHDEIEEEKKLNVCLEIEPKLIFELTQEDKNFLEATRRLDEEIGEEIELFESTQLLTEEVASTLIQSCIESMNVEEQKITSTPVEILKPSSLSDGQVINNGGGKKSKKNKKGNSQQQPPQAKTAQPQVSVQQPNKVTQLSQQQASKKSKKQAKKAEYKARKEAAEKLQADLENAKKDSIIEQIIIEEDVNEEEDDPTSAQDSPSKDLPSISQLERKANEDQMKSLTRKVVEFNVIREPIKSSRSPYRGYASSSADDQDDIKVPKRGSSSRGSSCTEEKIHQDTISMLGDLFPQQYKNPSDNTKEMISKITSSSSGGSQVDSALSSPDLNNFSLNKRPNQKFIEQPYENTVVGNQTKKKNNNRPHQSNLSVDQDNSTSLRIKPKAVKKEKQQQPQPVPPKSSSAQPVQPKQEFEGYDALFKSQAFENVSSKGSAAPLALPQDLKQPHESSTEHQSKLSDTISKQTGDEETKKPIKNKKKAHKDSTVNNNTNNTPIVKEMKERGAIVRPVDLENAKKKQSNTTNANPSIPRSHTPGVETPQESMAPSNASLNKQKQKGNSNGQLNSTGKVATSNQKQVNNQNKKKNQPVNNSQQIQKLNQPQQQPVHQNQSQITPQFDLVTDQNQQQSQLFAAQQLQHAAFMSTFGLLPQNQGNNFMLNPIANPSFPFPFSSPAQMQFGSQPNFNQLSAMMMANQLNPNQAMPANLLAGPNMFNPADFINPLDSNQVPMDRQTQTDETRIKDNINGAASASPQVINQFQNINVQVHLPAQQHHNAQVNGQPNPMMPGMLMDYQQQFLQAQLLNQMLMQNLPDQQQMQGFQNMIGINPFLFNPLLAAQQSPPGFPSPYLNPQAQFFAQQQQQQLLQQQQFTPFAPSQQQSPQQTQFMQPSQNFTPTSQRSFHQQQNKSTPQQNGTQNHFNKANNNTQLLLQEIVNQLSQQNMTGSKQQQSIENTSGSTSNEGGSSSISHITQEKQEEIYRIQAREEQFFIKMDQEIYKVQGQLKLKLASIETERQIALRKIENQVRITYMDHPEARIQMYGSMATGLAIDSSDMDLLISGVFCFDAQRLLGFPMPPYVERQLMIEQLQKLYKDLSNNKDGEEEIIYQYQEYIHSCQIIETASVPVIKVVIDLQKIRNAETKKTGVSSPDLIEADMRFLKIDITFNDSTDQQQQMFMNIFNLAQTQHMGIQCCNFILERLQMYPMLESLTLILKKFLAIRNLNSPFLGGLNSYGLIILIIAYLNENYHEEFGHDSQLSKARALKGFLYFYGKQFDQANLMINADQQIVPHQSFSQILIIQDPLNPQNNIGKSTFNFSMIRVAFSAAHDQIDTMMREYIDEASLPEGDKGSAEPNGMWNRKLDIIGKILSLPETAVNLSEEAQ